MSNKSSSNVEWKLDKLLSASRASRGYVTRQSTQHSGKSSSFSPWSPRDISKALMADQSIGNDQCFDVSRAVSVDVAIDTDDSDEDSKLDKEPAALTLDVINMTPDDIKKIRSEAFEQGKRQAQAEIERTRRDNELELSQILHGLSAKRIDFSSLNTTVAELSMFIASQVIRAEITINPQCIEELIDRCLEEIRRHGNDRITVRLSRMDFDRYNQRFLQAKDVIHLLADDTLDQGDIELEMGATRISERISAKLAHLAEKIFATLLIDVTQHDADPEASLTVNDE